MEKAVLGAGRSQLLYRDLQGTVVATDNIPRRGRIPVLFSLACTDHFIGATLDGAWA